MGRQCVLYITRISIHAPAKGATESELEALYVDTISIHAPAKGATYTPYRQAVSHGDFNPRSREGSDR